MNLITTQSRRMALPRGGTARESWWPRQLEADSFRWVFQTGVEKKALAGPTATNRAPRGVFVRSSEGTGTGAAAWGDAQRPSATPPGLSITRTGRAGEAGGDAVGTAPIAATV